MEIGKSGSALIYEPSADTVESLPNSLYVGHEYPRSMRQPHWHAQVEINYMVRGSLDYLIGHVELQLREGEMILFWGGMAHQSLRATPGADYVCIHLPLTDFFRIRFAPEIQTRVIRGDSMISTLHDPADMFNFVRWADYLRFGTTQMLENALEEVLLRVERSPFGPYRMVASGAAPSIHADIAESTIRQHVARMCNYIGENFREEISAADIADAATLHPKYAMNVFKKSTGMTLNGYITLLRLSYAQAMLMQAGVNVTDIAMDSGFNSLSAFNKSFAKMAGKSPSDFRRASNGRIGPIGKRQRVANIN